MDKKGKIIIAILILLIIATLVKMVTIGPFKWEVIVAGIICGGYGVKRIIDQKTIGYVLVGACILLMVIALTGFDLNQIM